MIPSKNENSKIKKDYGLHCQKPHLTQEEIITLMDRVHLKKITNSIIKCRDNSYQCMAGTTSY